MRNTLLASSAKVLPVIEPISENNGYLGAPITPACKRADLQTTKLDALELPSSTEQKLLLSELASAINQEHNLYQEACKTSLLHARRTGEYLLQAKSIVKKSTCRRWLSWLKQNCPNLPKRTAQAYMQVATNWHLIEKSATVALFGLRDALEFIAEKRKLTNPPVSCVGSTDVIDAEWTPAEPSQGAEATSANFLKERDRVVVTQDHPLFAGQHGTITGQPSVDAAVVLLDEGERERILVTHLQLEEQLKPQSLRCEPEASQSLFTNESSSAMPFSNTGCNSATKLITQDENDAVASEIAIGIKHLTPEQLAWAISASAASGLSSAHLEAAIKACKQALSQRYRPDHFRK